MVTWKTNFQILFITGFRKLHGTQHSTVTMLEKRKKSSRQKRISASLFMDLSKTFDTINHDPLLPKLLACGFSKNSLYLMCSYLKNGKRRVQIYNNLSAAKSISVVVPQGSVDGSTLFNLFINFLATLSNRNYVE